MRATSFKKLLWVTFYFLPLIAFSANFTGSRAVPPASQASTPNPAPPPAVTIYKGRRLDLANLFRPSAVSTAQRNGVPTAQEVRAYVQSQAAKLGVNPKLALWIVKHESQFNPRAKGDGEASRGLWQISKIYHPEVSDAMAFNVASSTEWSLERIRSGKVREWSTYRFCRVLYGDCPF
jgi:hypothetical protein